MQPLHAPITQSLCVLPGDGHFMLTVPHPCGNKAGNAGTKFGSSEQPSSDITLVAGSTIQVLGFTPCCPLNTKSSQQHCAPRYLLPKHTVHGSFQKHLLSVDCPPRWSWKSHLAWLAPGKQTGPSTQMLRSAFFCHLRLSAGIRWTQHYHFHEASGNGLATEPVFVPSHPDSPVIPLPPSLYSLSSLSLYICTYV